MRGRHDRQALDRHGDPGYSAVMDLIIFDLDGTLVNSEAIILGAQVRDLRAAVAVSIRVARPASASSD